MMDFVSRRPLLSGIAALLALFVLFTTFAIVPETRQGIVVRYAKPVRIVNRYEAGERFGQAGAGGVLPPPSGR